MVAISLKGNLHKAADVPHRWPHPTPKISLKDFKILLRRRTRALSRLSSDVATTSNHNPASAPNLNPNCGNVNPSPARNPEIEAGGGNNGDYRRLDSRLTVKVDLDGEGEKAGERKVADEVSVDGEGSLRKLVERSHAAVVKAEKDVENVNNDGVAEAPANKVVEKIKVENATADSDKRREVKEKLEILNEKKHSLVQVLKQILNAEEHLKRQTSTQGMSSRPPIPLQVDNNTTDSGSMIRVNTPRTGKDGGDMEGGGEGDDGSNHNTLSRNLPRTTSSTSPSSDSQQRNPPSNPVHHSHRSIAAGSPSRFAPAVSVSGASYVASSPSPAASGGTSVLRDGRLPSPWN